ncbi:hypothetical protein GCM10009799_20450 [Nocardiopsis rhodophaea]|uniref:Uncharacterized protein n=1 Tax=Nocardiopsis rhodophaea TaxID=280238 RepID=A0ABP5EEV7_9ACTN
MTTGGTCRVPECDTLVADAHVCAQCAHRLTIALDDVADLADELDVSLSRQSRRGGRVGARSAEVPLPFDVGASIVRAALVETLATWARVLSGDVLADLPGIDTPASAAAWLAERVEEIRHHVDGGHLVDEVIAAVEGARDEVHGPRSGASILAGQCPRCGQPVYARQGAPTARCRREGCAGGVDVEAWRADALAALADAVLPAADVVRALAAVGHPVEAGTLRSWVARGHLATADHQGAGGRARYRVADALTLARTRRHQGKIAS